MEENELLDAQVHETVEINTLAYPITIEFKIGTIANDFTARDANGRMIGYVRQKMFKFKEDIQVFADESKSKVNYAIKADKWIDFNTSYAFTNNNTDYIGRVGRKGMKSLWKASYDIFDDQNKPEYHIQEENPWAKVGDALLGEVPVLSMLTGYLCNPKYLVKNTSGEAVVRIKKEASFWGRKFTLEQLASTGNDDERIMLSTMMMLLLERRRG